MRDLLEKLNQLQSNEESLNEAPVQPGERKGISFKLKKLEKLSNELQKYQSSLHSMKYMELPPALKTEMKQIEDKLNAEIDKVNQAYQIEYEKSKANDRPVKMDNLFKALAKHCKEIIKVYKELNRNNFSREKFLFRGIRSNDDALYGKPFESRKPKDSNRDLHELVNGTINSLGYTANRENAMFVTGDRGQAGGYGYSLYIMFPVDGFTFTWSQTVKDLVLDNSKKLDMMDREVIDQIRGIVNQAKSQSPEGFPISYPDDLFRNGYDYENDRERLMRAVEDGKLPDNIEDLLDDVLTNKSIQEHFKFTDKNLFDAILSEKEIYIRGDYYAINFEHREELFKFLEEINTDDVELPENFGEVPNILDKGDVVTILNGTHQGKLGTITYTYSNEYEVFITQKTGDVTINKADVELYKLPDGSVPIFEKGDEVIVTDTDARQYGMVGTLNYVYPTGKVEFTDKDEKYYTLFKNQITAYSPELEQQILKDLETKPPTIEVNDPVVVSDPDSEYYKERGKVNYAYSTGTLEVYFPKKSAYIDFQPEQLTLVKNAGPELLSTEQGVFNVGDKVQISGGEYQGYYGTVEYLYSHGTEAEISLTGMDKKVDVDISDLQHYGKEKEKPKFKVGDKVKILSGDYAGDEAVVNYVSTVFPDDIDVKLVKNDELKTVPTTSLELISDTATSADLGSIQVGDSVIVSNPKSEYFNKPATVTAKLPNGNIQVKVGNKLKAFPIQDLAPADSSVNIKVGDTVKVINHESSYYGQVGEVTEIGQTPDGKPWIKFNSPELIGGIKTFVNWVEKVGDQPEFKEGDKVQINYSQSLYNGKEGTVSAGPDEDGDYKVAVGNKITYVPANGMKKIDNVSASSEFAMGDKVKILDKSSSFYGEIGEIENGPDIDGDYTVIFNNDDNEWSYFQPDAMEKVNKPKVTPKFNEGDTVKITGPSAYNNNSYVGYAGTITSVSSDGLFAGVRVEDGTGDTILTYDVTNLSKSETPDIDSLTWEPEPEVKAPFKEGDKVEVVSQFPSLIGKTGTILQTNPNYGFVSLQLDGNTEPSSFPVSALKKIEQQEDNTTLNAPSDLGIGDTVEVINKNLSSFRKQGKIIDMNPTFIFVDFNDDGQGESAVKPSSVKKIG